MPVTALRTLSRLPRSPFVNKHFAVAQSWVRTYRARVGDYGNKCQAAAAASPESGDRNGWCKKRRDDGTDDGTPGGRYATGHCAVVVYVRRTHDGTMARGVQATGQTTGNV